MKKYLFFVFILFLLSSCQEKRSYIDGRTNNHDEIIYFKDTRTGLCYSEIGGGEDYSHTCVPCSEEVLELIDSRSTKK